MIPVCLIFVLYALSGMNLEQTHEVPLGVIEFLRATITNLRNVYQVDIYEYNV
jgi:hypothetical protein